MYMGEHTHTGGLEKVIQIYTQQKRLQTTLKCPEKGGDGEGALEWHEAATRDRNDRKNTQGDKGGRIH